MWHKDTGLSVYPVQAYSREGFYNPSRLGHNDTEMNLYGTQILDPIFDSSFFLFYFFIY